MFVYVCVFTCLCVCLCVCVFVCGAFAIIWQYLGGMEHMGIGSDGHISIRACENGFGWMV